jgi:hypothetical protein
MSTQPGTVILFGSGETAPTGRRIYDELFAHLRTPIRGAILETPAGFEPNSEWVAQQVADFWATRLQNYRPRTAIIPARKKETPHSPDNPDLLTPLYTANVIFSGAGSPTYAVRQLRDTLAWQLLRTAHRMGAAVVFASASTLAASRFTIPVYEIYKVGEELHWRDGLDFFGAFGLELIFVPHWNNKDGGAVLDTSNCYLGQSRFDQLRAMLPSDTATIVGIEEHTALWVEIATATCRVVGQGNVVVIRGEHERTFATGTEFSIRELGDFTPTPMDVLPESLFTDIQRARADLALHTPQPSSEVLTLAQHRQQARASKEWQRADALRDELLTRGWQVQDTPDGAVLIPVE